MGASGSISSVRRTGVSVFHALAWIVVTLWLGVVGLWRAIRFLTHVRHGFSRTLRCPRGHEVDAYGPLRCGRCQAAFEGHVFDPCPVCGAKARFIACRSCGLALKDPLA
jgi:hypothetical protein